jgi:hypothetical protein
LLDKAVLVGPLAPEQESFVSKKPVYTAKFLDLEPILNPPPAKKTP